MYKILNDIQEQINKIQEIMIAVSTGELQIQECNEEYKKRWLKLDNILYSSKIENPNPHSDLWEFYAYWKKRLNSYAERRAYVAGLYKKIRPSRVNVNKNFKEYVNFNRIKELRVIQNKNYDLTKLIRLCEELNQNYQMGCYFSCAMLGRTIIDHVPPIFNQKTFNEVVNNYNGSRSFKKSMSSLQTSLRNISDAHLHEQIRNKEILPNGNQVDFSSDLDVLLGEICRILK